jgi:hypothetical protein
MVRRWNVFYSVAAGRPAPLTHRFRTSPRSALVGEAEVHVLEMARPPGSKWCIRRAT